MPLKRRRARELSRRLDSTPRAIPMPTPAKKPSIIPARLIMARDGPLEMIGGKAGEITLILAVLMSRCSPVSLARSR